MSLSFWEYHFKDQLDRIKIRKKFKHNQCEIKYRRNLIFYWYASISNIIWKFPSSRCLYLVILSENKNVMTMWNEPILPIGKRFFLFLFWRMIWYNFCVHFPFFSFLLFFLTWGKNSLCNPGWSGMKLTYYVVQAGFKLTAIFLSLIEGIIGICIMLFCVSVQISKAAFFSSNSIVLQLKSNNQKGFWSYFWFLLRKERSEMSEMRNVSYKWHKICEQKPLPKGGKGD